MPGLSCRQDALEDQRRREGSFVVRGPGPARRFGPQDQHLRQLPCRHHRASSGRQSPGPAGELRQLPRTADRKLWRKCPRTGAQSRPVGFGHLPGLPRFARHFAADVAGIVLLLVGAYHVVYILGTNEGRRLVRDLFPVKKDLPDVLCAVRYLLGLSKEKPLIGRFGYAEKMEYWAVVWGTIIMGVTGLMIWFKIDVTRFLPRWAVDVAVTIHYYEAILGSLAIVVWHFYHVIFDPDVYPLNLACWDGKVSGHWQAEEHPLDQNPRQPVEPAASEAKPTDNPKHN